MLGNFRWRVVLARAVILLAYSYSFVLYAFSGCFSEIDKRVREKRVEYRFLNVFSGRADVIKFYAFLKRRFFFTSKK